VIELAQFTLAISLLADGLTVTPSGIVRLGGKAVAVGIYSLARAHDSARVVHHRHRALDLSVGDNHRRDESKDVPTVVAVKS
jgi:hypothetical protein